LQSSIMQSLTVPLTPQPWVHKTGVSPGSEAHSLDELDVAA
jgi:hypothetical protein